MHSHYIALFFACLAATSTLVSSQYPISTDGNCGPLVGTMCAEPRCCSKFGSCGTTLAFCAFANCQYGYGLCASPSSTQTVTASQTASKSQSDSQTQTASMSPTSSKSRSMTPTASQTASRSFSSSISFTSSQVGTISDSSSNTPSPSQTGSQTRTSSQTNSRSQTPSQTNSRSQTITSTSTVSVPGLSNNGNCGPAVGLRCGVGLCCSRLGFCGSGAVRA